MHLKWHRSLESRNLVIFLCSQGPSWVSTKATGRFKYPKQFKLVFGFKVRILTVRINIALNLSNTSVYEKRFFLTVSLTGIKWSSRILKCMGLYLTCIFPYRKKYWYWQWNALSLKFISNSSRHSIFFPRILTTNSQKPLSSVFL